MQSSYLLIVYFIAGQLIRIFQRVTDAKYCTLELVRLQLKQKRTARSKKGLFLQSHSTYSFQVNRRRTSIALSYFGILLPTKCLKAPVNDLNDTPGATSENRTFEYKEDKVTTQILNLTTKKFENKHFIHFLKRFPQTFSVCFCNTNI